MYHSPLCINLLVCVIQFCAMYLYKQIGTPINLSSSDITYYKSSYLTSMPYNENNLGLSNLEGIKKGNNLSLKSTYNKTKNKSPCL